MNSLPKVSEVFSFLTIFTFSSILSNEKTEMKQITFIILGHETISSDLYSKLNEKIERMTKLIDFFFFKLQIFPQAAIFLLRTVIHYYVFDMGESSFDLPLQVVYV